MDGKKEFLTEENYERGKKKIMRIALIILIVGFLLGGSLIATGIIKTNSAKKQNEQTAQQIDQNDKSRAEAEVQADIDKIQSQIDAIDNQITNLKTEESRLRNEQQKIFSEDRGFSDRYYTKGEEITAKGNEIKAKQKEKSKLETSLSSYENELWKINSGYNDTQKQIEKSRNSVSTSKYFPFYMFGAFIIIASCMFAGSIFIFTKRREILAFQAQQVMPVAQEGIEKMAPSIGKAGASIGKEMAPTYGEIAKEISKGIKEGLNNNNSDNSSSNE